ncbi:MAG TPA: DUF167 domain-containing protein [Gemmatimonadales bacterium]
MKAIIAVHVMPRARKTEVAGRHGAAIKIKVAAPPVQGAANAELVRFIAERLRVPRDAVTIRSGAAGRRKTIAVEGVATDVVTQQLLSQLE